VVVMSTTAGSSAAAMAETFTAHRPGGWTHRAQGRVERHESGERAHGRRLAGAGHVSDPGLGRRAHRRRFGTHRRIVSVVRPSDPERDLHERMVGTERRSVPGEKVVPVRPGGFRIDAGNEPLATVLQNAKPPAPK
jgi:hypothetical protein